ncbi:hypothetical protein Taro_009049 [Colocasia esculenta]|uniref:Uncharacterized protein n=1 Tax=Colocasia esculenta TaxID=4460 RepID=A0A843U8V0_COLES|nr:hypothetical protein [Colocasia esculenta]
MAWPAMVAAATQGGDFSAAALGSSSRRPSPLPLLEAQQPVPPSTLNFRSRSRAWSQHLVVCIPSRRATAACLKSSPSFGFPNKDEPSVENSVDNEQGCHGGRPGDGSHQLAAVNGGRLGGWVQLQPPRHDVWRHAS